MKQHLIFIGALLLSACVDSNIDSMLQKEANFIGSVESKEIELVTLRRGDMAAQFTNFGARIVSLIVPDRDGCFRDVVWGYSSLDEYLNATDKYSGPIVGRFGNRINNGEFSLDGETYKLTINDGKNHLHGGAQGFSEQVWEIVSRNEDMVEMRYYSPNMEAGYPGNLTITVKYCLTLDNSLVIEYVATTDAATILNPTSHAYFNLNGDDSSILDHILQIAADNFTPTDNALIPTGEICTVESTPMDFREPTAIGQRIDQDYKPLMFGSGYDHNWVFSQVSYEKPQVVLYSQESGIEMSVYTNQPAVQFYSGNFMDGVDVGKRGDRHNYRSGVALEAQNFPDAPNHSNFPSALLRPSEEYYQITGYKFAVR